MTKKYLIVIMLCLLLGAYSADASIMESKNYRLESDEINMGAIGEMRDFSGLSQGKELASKTGQNLPEGPVVLFTYKISSWEIIFGSALALLFLVFVYYFVLKKRLPRLEIIRQERNTKQTNL